METKGYGLCNHNQRRCGKRETATVSTRRRRWGRVGAEVGVEVRGTVEQKLSRNVIL